VFYRELTVGEHLELVAAAFDDPEGVARGRAVLAELGLAGRLGARAHELSSGQRQKALLACIHARRFDALLLDEPVLRLDPGSQQWLRERLAAHLRAGVAVVLATHQPPFAAGLARRVVCLEEGRVLADEPLEGFLARGADRLIGRLALADGAAGVPEEEAGGA
jgi:ABC-type multidrug transport system ATPase subunit